MVWLNFENYSVAFSYILFLIKDAITYKALYRYLISILRNEFQSSIDQYSVMAHPSISDMKPKM